jgi:hypothetical protein
MMTIGRAVRTQTPAMLRQRPFLADSLVAAAFVAWVLGEVAAGAVVGPGWQNVVAGLVATVPLARRRVLPEACGLVCAAGVTVKTGLGLNMDGVALLTAVFFASDSVGRWVAPRRALVVVATMVALVWAALWRVPGTGPYDWIFALMWIGGPGVAATLLQHQLTRAAVLRPRRWSARSGQWRAATRCSTPRSPDG